MTELKKTNPSKEKIRDWLTVTFNGSTLDAAIALGYSQRAIQSWVDPTNPRVPPMGAWLLILQDAKLRAMTTGDGAASTACDDQRRPRHG